eukprot:CAMPEP_0170373808 /NCGR_PEP_ID=MMETSP0117_2-20130122/10263_1 /TAXON_ID=400756 /ORGANISM="Durinskia baltica, Strain CSIRO CS-38" /LENGTH=99 /DNA_ID=CAMNT_0010628717 /DNA_START=1 /DNA_END=296 /DNA_ORIENTATION=-
MSNRPLPASFLALLAGLDFELAVGSDVGDPGLSLFAPPGLEPLVVLACWLEVPSFAPSSSAVSCVACLAMSNRPLPASFLALLAALDFELAVGPDVGDP